MMTGLNYASARKYLNEVSRKTGSVPGLDSIKKMLVRLENPQNSVPVIHVAGTNGKGSFSAMISEILICAGYNTGMYVSPYVFDYNEIIRYNDVNISNRDYANEISHIKEHVSEMKKNMNYGDRLPTAFEMETAAAFSYFAHKGCDIAVVETGMGGADDATNVCDSPVMTVIMSVGLDHMKYLGNTPEEIALTKAGIIKTGCPVILYRQSERVMKIIESVAQNKKAPLVITDNVQNVKYCLDSTEFDYECCDGTRYTGLKIGLQGTYQPYNSAAVIEAVRVLNDKGYIIKEDALRNGLAGAKWPGRFERLGSEPPFYIDGAHNPNAAAELLDSIKTYFRDDEIIYITGVLADKDYNEILRLMAETAGYIYTVTPRNKRAFSAEKLAECAKKYNKNVSACETIDDAVTGAIDMVRKIENGGKKAAIIAFGSLSYMADVKESYNRLIGHGGRR